MFGRGVEALRGMCPAQASIHLPAILRPYIIFEDRSDSLLEFRPELLSASFR